MLTLISGSQDDLPPPAAFYTRPQECPPAFRFLPPSERLARSQLQGLSADGLGFILFGDIAEGPKISENKEIKIRVEGGFK